MAATLQQRRKAFAITSGSGLLLTLMALVLLNILANWVYLRVDLTRQNSYSLSRSSKKLAHDLDDRVVVKAFFSPDLPSPYNSYARYVRDLLAEYKSASRGKMTYEFVLTSPPQDFEEKAREAQLVPVQFQQTGNDQLQIKRGYMGIVLYYRDKNERIPIVKGVENLEYALTSKLARMVRREKKTIAFSSGHGEVQWRLPQSPLAQDLEELYSLKDQPLTGSATAPFQADAFFVVGPKQKFDDKALWQLDQAIMQGIPTVFFIDASNVQVQRFMAMPNNTGLQPLLEHYGINIGNRMVLDQQCESVTMTQNLGGFAFNTNMPYPYIVAVSNFASSDPLTRDLSSVGLPFVSTVESKAPSGIQFTSLLYSSPRSWLAPPDNYRISPDAITPPHADEPHGPYILGAMLSGRFTSFFQGKPSPVPGATPIAQSPPTQVMVLATSQIFSPDMPPFPGAQALLTNAMAVFSHDETLVGIHSKEQIFRPLKPIAGSMKGVVQMGCTLGIAFLAVAFGVYRWRRRQAWREWLGAGFNGA